MSIAMTVRFRYIRCLNSDKPPLAPYCAGKWLTWTH